MTGYALTLNTSFLFFFYQLLIKNVIKHNMQYIYQFIPRFRSDSVASIFGMCAWLLYVWGYVCRLTHFLSPGWRTDGNQASGRELGRGHAGRQDWNLPYSLRGGKGTPTTQARTHSSHISSYNWKSSTSKCDAAAEQCSLVVLWRESENLLFSLWESTSCLLWWEIRQIVVFLLMGRSFTKALMRPLEMWKKKLGYHVIHGRVSKLLLPVFIRAKCYSEPVLRDVFIC